MSSIHRIRLNGFWEATPLADGRVRHVRRFGRPRTSDPGEIVWVVGDGPGPTTVSLNGEVLGTAAGPWAFDVMARLHPRNELAVETPTATPPSGVAVEIR